MRRLKLACTTGPVAQGLVLVVCMSPEGPHMAHARSVLMDSVRALSSFFHLNFMILFVMQLSPLNTSLKYM